MDNLGRFACEPPEPIRITGENVGQDLERDVPIELCIAGAIDLTHLTGPKGGKDLVRAEAGAKSEGQLRGWIIRARPRRDRNYS